MIWWDLYIWVGLALLKAQVSLQLRKVFSFYNVLTHVLTFKAAYSSLSDTVLSLNVYECFMNTKYLCACLKIYNANLSLKQG